MVNGPEQEDPIRGGKRWGKKKDYTADNVCKSHLGRYGEKGGNGVVKSDKIEKEKR